mgnify:FL=1
MTTAYLPASTLTAIASLSGATSTDKFSPILSVIKVTLTPETVTAVATDRYIAARLTTPLGDVAHTVSDAGSTFYLNAADATMLAKLKTGGMLTWNDETREVTAEMDNHSRFTLHAVDGNYPPVERLIPSDTAEHDIPAGVGLNPTTFAKLAKFALPGEKAAELKKAAYRLGIEKLTDSHKSGPIVATRSGGGSYLTVIVQPNLIRT